MRKELDFLNRAVSLGYQPSIEGKSVTGYWIKWIPALPVDLIMKTFDLDENKLAKIIENHMKNMTINSKSVSVPHTSSKTNEPE